jgi:hypothetical protein
VTEILCVCIAWGVFTIGWGTRHKAQTEYLFLLGCFYGVVGIFDLLHALSYEGMNVFQTNSPNLATQLWISGRFLEAAGFAVSTFLLGKEKVSLRAIWLSIPAGSLILAFIFSGHFPDCYTSESGLTTFKILSEYFICFTLATSFVLFYLKPKPPLLKGKTALTAAIFTSITAELLFTTYLSVYGFSNYLGHLFKVISFLLIYDTFVASAIKYPYLLLAQELKQEKEALELAHEELKSLTDLLPICCHCKKIRDDEGYWEQIEHYFSKTTDTKFSHGICPECAKQIYPEPAESMSKEQLKQLCAGQSNGPKS